MHKISMLALFLVLLSGATASAQASQCEEGFVSLFDGKSLDGWIGATDGYEVKEGAIVCIPKIGGNLFTEKEYGDFHLKFEFRLTPGGNNGIAIRSPNIKGSAAYEGIEIQILDNSAEKYQKLQPYQFHGSVYGVIPAKREGLKPVGEWNSQEIIYQGSRIQVILNGITIVDGDVLEASNPQTIDGKNHPGLKRTKGHIGFLGHGSAEAFRNLRIKEL
jgi:hypothetical protein